MNPSSPPFQHYRLIEETVYRAWEALTIIYGGGGAQGDFLLSLSSIPSDRVVTLKC